MRPPLLIRKNLKESVIYLNSLTTIILRLLVGTIARIAIMGCNMEPYHNLLGPTCMCQLLNANKFLLLFQEIQIGPDHQAEVPEMMGPNYQDGESGQF